MERNGASRVCTEELVTFYSEMHAIAKKHPVNGQSDLKELLVSTYCRSENRLDPAQPTSGPLATICDCTETKRETDRRCLTEAHHMSLGT